MTNPDFIRVTERGGEPVSSAQLDRFYQRYIWAGRLAAGKDVLEMACGTGPGLGHLNGVSRHFIAGDIAPSVLALAKQHYAGRVELHQFDASKTPFANQVFDLVILFEAIYYIPDVDALVIEVARLLRPGGKFLLATANKDLHGFNPSPFSRKYLNPPEMRDLFIRHGFHVEFHGGSPIPESSVAQRLTLGLKTLAVSLKLIPGSMQGKRLLKRLVFGKLVQMPMELQIAGASYSEPQPISANHADTRHQVLYCTATKA